MNELQINYEGDQMYVVARHLRQENNIEPNSQSLTMLN